jgi:transcriptional regulator with XRE-family HTH domain
MKGSDWAEWRKRLGYSTSAIMLELGITSRQTINNWEKADKVPRLAELALYALENCPECQKVFGKGVTKTEGRRYFAQRS